MFYIIGISIAFLLGLLLLSKKGKTLADKILACWLLLIGVHLLLFYLDSSKLSFQYPFLLGLIIPLPLIHGPSLFLYTASLTNQLTVRKKLLFLHFIPVIASYLYLILFFIFLPAAQKVFISRNEGLGYEPFLLINLIAIVISGISYILWSIILLKRYRLSILNYCSYTEKVNLKWLQYLVYGLSSIWILIFFSDEYIFAGVVLFVLFIGYFGIKQVGIFTTRDLTDQLLQPPSHKKGEIVQPTTDSTGLLIKNEPLPKDPGFSEPNAIVAEKVETAILQDDNIEKKKYSKSGLTAEMAEELHSKLTKLMDTEKVYTESELFLSELAYRLNTLPNYLSQVINEKEGKNFYDYINTLRIEEFKRLISLPENKKYTILSLSFDCGFNSKSSFNKNFKKATGQSPSEYLNSLNIKTV
jgi:AraC-like DNA-binding protein